MSEVPIPVQLPEGVDEVAGVLRDFVAQQDRELLSPARLDESSTLKVAWLTSKNPFLGGEYYRATRPAALASKHFGWHTAVVFNLGEVEGSGRVVGVTQGGHYIDPDVLIVRPVGSSADGSYWTMREVMDRAHANGQAIIADLDDDIWSHEDWLDPGRPNDDGYEDWCWQSDAWLVSTPQLFSRVTERKPAGTPVRIAPNCYDPYGMDPGYSPVAGRRIGTRLWLSGRMTPDLDIYRECFGPLLESLDLEWVHIGREHGLEDGPGVHQRDFSTACGFPGDRLLELPSCTVPQLGGILAMTTSIGAIALGDHPYNRAKTETHAIELASAGLPIVAATTLPHYAKVPGRVDPTPEAVERKVRMLVSDRDHWAKAAHAAKTWARQVAARSEAAYMEALADVVTGVLARRHAIR